MPATDMTESGKTSLLNRMNIRKIFYGLGIALVLILVLMQFVRFVIPVFAISNPEVTYTVNWDSPRTEDLWNAACADCHSNETVWPWYSYIAPVTFLVTRDTNHGRHDLNVSENHDIDLGDMIEEIQDGSMPLPVYTITHPEARLSDSEKEELIAGLRATFGNGNSGQSTPEGNDDDDDE